jgi:hypothetical protein
MEKLCLTGPSIGAQYQSLSLSSSSLALTGAAKPLCSTQRVGSHPEGALPAHCPPLELLLRPSDRRRFSQAQIPPSVSDSLAAISLSPSPRLGGPAAEARPLCSRARRFYWIPAAAVPLLCSTRRPGKNFLPPPPRPS